MPGTRSFAEFRLVNGSTGDPLLYLDAPGRGNAMLFDAGEISALGSERLADLEAVFLTHHHVDHFIGFDQIVRANLDHDKALHVYGPEGTIRKVYDRIKSYEYPFFPFQKIVLNVHEVLPQTVRSALLECARRFPRPKVEEQAWNEPLIYETDDLVVEAAHVDHTVPCLAFALVTKPGTLPDLERLAAGPLRPGPWVGQAAKLIREGASPDTSLTIQGKPHDLGSLQSCYFSSVEGARIAYVTDTAWSERVRPALLRLADGADRLYCDAFYADEQIAQAEKHRHMTATQAGEFALNAGVKELILIHFSARYKGRYDALLDEARAIFPRVSAEFPPESLNNMPP